MKALLLLFILLSTVHAENTLPVKPNHGAKSPVPDGVEVSLKLPEKVQLGDMITGTFTVKNTGGEPFEISTGGDYRGTGFPLRLKIRVTDSQGDVLPDASEGLQDHGGLMGTGKRRQPLALFAIICKLQVSACQPSSAPPKRPAIWATTSRG